MTTTVAGTFPDKAKADDAIDTLARAGIEAHIDPVVAAPGVEGSTNEGEVSGGALKGAAIGGAIGLGVGIVGGPAGMAGGAAVGAYVGSLAGAFNGMSEEVAEPPLGDESVKVEAEVPVEADRALATAVLRHAGAQDVKQT